MSFDELEVLFFLLLPQAADTISKAKSAAVSAFIPRTSRTVSRPPCPVEFGGNCARLGARLLQPDSQDDCSEGEDERCGNSESIEVPFDHG